MPPKFDTPTEIVIAELEQVIPQAMAHEGVDRVLVDYPDLKGKNPRSLPPKQCPGLSIALIRDAKCVWAKGYGVKSTETGEVITPDTNFLGWSLSKPVSAYAALKMCELGMWELDRPLQEYFSDPTLPNDPQVEKITLRMVLTHTSGLWCRGHNPYRDFFFESPPGGRFDYSSVGFYPLRRVMEHLSGMPFEQYMKENLLDPFGMYDSSFVWQDRFKSQMADLHNADGTVSDPDKTDYRSRPAEACCSLVSTPSDYAKFMAEILQPSSHDQYRLSQKSIAEMLTPQVRVSDILSWGLGWSIQHTDDEDSFWHWGGFGHTLAVAFQEHKMGVVIFTNCAGGLSWEDIVLTAIGGKHPILPWKHPYGYHIL